MLALTRRVGETIVIGDGIRVTVVAVERDQVKIAVDAPRHITVHRSEVYDAIVHPPKRRTP
jgi:carbon storage regulator